LDLVNKFGCHFICNEGLEYSKVPSRSLFEALNLLLASHPPLSIVTEGVMVFFHVVAKVVEPDILIPHELQLIDIPDEMGVPTHYGH
jgi:hypothetical protein